MESILATNHNGHSGGNPHIIKVLLYHRIVDDKELSRAHWTCLHIEQFRRHLELLDRWGFTAITFNDYELFRRGELNLPARPVIITFDDGYLDTYKHAIPLLQKFGMKGVVYALGDRKFKMNYWDWDLGLPKAPLMEGRHVQVLHEAGIEIGAHSMSHAKLTGLPEATAWKEISHSRMVLEALINAPVQSFSYPYGCVNATVKQLVKQAGYPFACGVDTGPAVFGVDEYEIRRVTMFNNINTAGFAARLLSFYTHYSWLKWTIGQSAFMNFRKRNGASQKAVEGSDRQMAFESQVKSMVEASR